MAEVRKILSRKGSEVFSVEPDVTVHDAADTMNRHQIGALVVLENARVVGMFTERDVLRRVITERRDPATTTVGDVMTREVVCCKVATPIDQARSVLMTKRIRHLPILDDDEQLLGLISIGDLNAWQLDGQEAEIHNLQEYIYGRT